MTANGSGDPFAVDNPRRDPQVARAGSEDILHMMSPCKGGGGMQPVADLLRRALREGDERGLTLIRSQHLPDDVMADLAKQTHQHALDNAAGDSSDGWLVFREGIGPWWCEAAGLTDDEFRRLYKLLTDVVKRLTEQRLAYRRPPTPRCSMSGVMLRDSLWASGTQA
jgi:hypothetical protein